MNRPSEPRDVPTIHIKMKFKGMTKIGSIHLKNLNVSVIEYDECEQIAVIHFAVKSLS